MPDPANFLGRWSRRKNESRATGRTPAEAPASEAKLAATGPAVPADPAAPPPAVAAPLPTVESLTPQSDFAPFMGVDVDADVRRSALKTLFSDPRFNTMDMLDVYVDDYSKPDPLPQGWLARMEQMSSLGDKGARDREEAARREAQAAAQASADAATGEGASDGPDPQDAPTAAVPEPEAEPGPEPAPSAQEDAEKAPE